MTDSSPGAGEAPLKFRDSESLEAWLKTQKREASVVIAARAALRVLPLAASTHQKNASEDDAQQFAQLIEAAFRAATLAWVVGTYPTHANNLRAAARAARGAAYASYASYVAAHADGTADAARVAYAAYAAADAARAVTATAAAAAAGAAATDGDDDANWIAGGRSASELAGRPLWPEGAPDWAASSWRRLRDILAPELHWKVRLDWYQARLDGRCRPEPIELIYASAPRDLWDEPEKENEWIAAELAQIETETSPSAKASLPHPIANLPSPFAYGWNSAAKLTIIAGPQNLPIFPLPASERDHAQWLESCRKQVERLLADLGAGRVNARVEFREGLERYVGDLPTQPGLGNFVLADAEARILRDMFAAEVDVLSAAFASRLRAFLVQHIALRGFYPEVERLYGAVQRGRLEEPLPQDAVEGFDRVVRENTPALFEPEVSSGLREVERQPPPIVEIAPEEIRRHDLGRALPPPDPLGELDPQKSRSYSVASSFNEFWKVFREGEKIEKNAVAWERIAEQLGPHAEKLLDWLHRFLDGAS